MSVAETRARIIIDSANAQRSLENLAKSMESFNKSISVGNFNSFNSGISKANVELKTLTSSILKAETGLRALSKMGSTIGTVLGGAYEYTTSLESNAVGISGILASMTKLDGKTLEWNKALLISKNIMQELRTSALQTASTAPELIDTFRAILGPAMGAGMKINEVMQLTTVGVNAVKSMGLKDDQLTQELRSIIQGNIRPASSTLATALGITNADVKNAIKSSDGLFKFLMERLKGFEKSVTETSNTIKGRIAILTEAFYQSVEQASTPVFDSIKETLQDLTKRILVYNDELKRYELNDKFIEQLKTVSNFVNEIIGYASSIGKSLFNNISGLTEALTFFLRAETYIGVAGLLIAGLSKFKDLIVQACQFTMQLYSYVFKIEEKQERMKAIEVEINNSLKAQKGNTQEIDDFNRSIINNLRKEINANERITQELEKQKKLLATNLASESSFTQQHNAYPNLNAYLLRSYGKQMNMSGVEIEKSVKEYYEIYKKYGAKHANDYMVAFKNALGRYSINDEIKVLMQKANSELSAMDFSKLASARNNAIRQNVNFDPNQLRQINELDLAFAKLSETMKKAGVSQNAISQEMVRFTKEAIVTSGDLTRVKINLNAQQIKEYENNLKSQIMYDNLNRSIAGVSTILTGLGFAYQFVTNENDSCLGKMAEWGVKAGVVIGAIGQIGAAMRELILITKELNIMLLFQNLLKLGSAHPAIAIALGVGAVAYGGYKLMEGTDGQKIRDDYELKQRTDKYTKNLVYIDNPNMEDTATQHIQMLEQAQKDRLNTIDINNLTNAFGTGGDGSDRHAQRQAEQAERLRQNVIQAGKDYDILVGKINIANNKLSGSYSKYQEEIDNADEKTKQWKKSLDGLVRKAGGSFNEETGLPESFGGFDPKKYEEALKFMEDYKKLSKEQAEINRSVNDYENQLKNINNLQATGVLTTREANAERIGVLQREISMYDELAEKFKNCEDEKIKYQTLATEARKALQEAELTDGTVHWDRVIEHIKNTTYNLTETVNSGLSGMLGSITNFGQNLLTESKSIAQRFKDLFKNLANDLLNMIMKVIMQGLVMNAILGIGGGSIKTGSGVGSINSVLPTEGIGFYGGVGHFAKGGVAKGWSIVGEKGAELVNFSSPGRVYTAEQTKKALNGSGGNVNIKIDLKNESGQQIKAEQTGSTFDGENYVIGIVLKAMNTNKGGIRTAMKGLVNA